MDSFKTSLDPRNLKEHPRNKELYGDTVSENVREQIKKAGRILEPLLVTTNNVVISGHQRRRIAIELGFSKVPCIVETSLTDDLDILEILLQCNEKRDLTNEQKIRMYETYKEIEAERAKKRQATSTGGKEPKAKEQLPQICAEADKPSVSRESRAVAAKKVGVSHTTAEKGVKVLSQIDTLKKEGKIQDAESLREKLNTQSVNAAYQEVALKPKKPSVPQSIMPKVQTNKKEFDKHYGPLFRTIDALNGIKPNSVKHEQLVDLMRQVGRKHQEWIDG